jgi:hypothetical protein
VLEDCEKLTGARKTVVVTVGSTTAKEVNDSFKTARPADAALPDFWTGKTVFQIQKVSPEVNAMRIIGKQTVPSFPAPPGLEAPAVPLSQATGSASAAEVVDPVPTVSTAGSMPSQTYEAKQAKGITAPYEPTDAERAAHNLTHLPFRNW